MKMTMKKIMGLLLLCLTALALHPACPVQAAYTGMLGYQKDLRNLKNGFQEMAVYSPADERGYYEVYVDGIYGRTCKNMKASSSDKKIATVTYSSEHKCFMLTPKKPGTVRLTFSAIRKGKKITCKGVVKVVKFKNPVQKLAINGKNYAKNVKTAYSVLHIKPKETKVKFQYKLQPGWKVESTYGEAAEPRDGLGFYLPVKNNKTYILKKGEMHIWMTLKNSKRGERVSICLSLER